MCSTRRANSVLDGIRWPGPFFRGPRLPSGPARLICVCTKLHLPPGGGKIAFENKDAIAQSKASMVGPSGNTGRAVERLRERNHRGFAVGVCEP